MATTSQSSYFLLRLFDEKTKIKLDDASLSKNIDDSKLIQNTRYF
ncbi:hypothetical protein P20652_3468 [Pseudoalteromonas sp. BSi20652]|nr:hypothetical protein P20652_3468 [Pseudoalteromonas sp. BSi20652]